jgi:hypothetical protein
VSEVCQISANTPLKPRDSRGRSDAHRCWVESLMESALVRVGVRQHAPAGIYFQACSFNHSDISPHLESTICGWSRSDYRTRRQFQSLPSKTFAFSGLARTIVSVPGNCVRPPNVARSLTAISLSYLARRVHVMRACHLPQVHQGKRPQVALKRCQIPS